MQPNPLSYSEYEEAHFYTYNLGELNEVNRLHGRGIQIWNDWNDDEIWIGYYKNGKLSPGNYIRLYSNGDFSVGEVYDKDGGRRKERCTRYSTNGTKREYGY